LTLSQQSGHHDIARAVVSASAVVPAVDTRHHVDSKQIKSIIELVRMQQQIHDTGVSVHGEEAAVATAAWPPKRTMLRRAWKKSDLIH
jgi:hypothetical protein